LIEEIMSEVARRGLAIMALGSVLTGLGNAQETTLFQRTQKQAEQGDASAQVRLGLMYSQGRGVPQNDTEAVKWYRAAAEQGNVTAQNTLGMRYYFGDGVPESKAEAAKWYRLAAEQGKDNAQYNLGLMYANGEGVPENYVEAYKWFNLAAAQGDKQAAENKELIRKTMTPEQIAEAQRLSAEWQPKQ
jgi:hypothetical protein